MKGRISVVISLILALVLVALVAAQTSNSGSSGTTSASQGSTTSQKTEKAKKVHLPPNFSADEAYKQNLHALSRGGSSGECTAHENDSAAHASARERYGR